MRRFTVLLTTLAALAVFLPASSAIAAPPPDRPNVPESAFASYRAQSMPYREVQASIDAGYGELADVNGVTCIADDEDHTGAMGVHYVNVDLVLDGEISADEPEAFVYAPREGGSLQLVALEYVVFKPDWDASHDAPPELFAGHPFDETGAPNRFGLPAYYSQHVWLWRGNPSGNLSMWNPNVRCP